jgi:ribA/ribD-fused uncharacterized protein
VVAGRFHRGRHDLPLGRALHDGGQGAAVRRYGQHEDLLGFLLGTGSRVLVEASPQDAIWGIGLAADDDRAASPENWPGLNLLGFALMEVRHQLRSRD